MTSLMVTRQPEGGYPESEPVQVSVIDDAVCLTLDDGEQITFLEEDLDRCIVEERRQSRSAA